MVDGAFLRTLQVYRGGEVLSELSDALRKVTEAVASIKKPGLIVLTVRVSPSGEAYAYEPTVSMKLPTAKKTAALFFLDDEFNLVRDRPGQEELPLRVLDGNAEADHNQPPLKKVEEAHAN